MTPRNEKKDEPELKKKAIEFPLSADDALTYYSDTLNEYEK